MLRFGKTKVAKEEIYVAKKLVKTWDANVENIVLSKSVETKNNSEYWIGYLVEVIRPFVLLLPKMSDYVKIFKDESGIKNKNFK